jgi:hypothetical protein
MHTWLGPGQRSGQVAGSLTLPLQPPPPNTHCRCAQLETQLAALQSEASEARAQLTSLVRAQDSLHAETEKRLAAAKAAAAAEREALQSRSAAKIKKLQETAKDQVGGGSCTGSGNGGGGRPVAQRKMLQCRSTAKMKVLQETAKYQVGICMGGSGGGAS